MNNAELPPGDCRGRCLPPMQQEDHVLFTFAGKEKNQLEPTAIRPDGVLMASPCARAHAVQAETLQQTEAHCFSTL